MVSLPASIETYLQDAGFTSTEILILKKLLEGDSMTLRELASKTGKSTGVLSQATKKLAEKHIISKEHINEVEKYVIGSLDAVHHWVERDMHKQHEALQRKKLDFDAFLSTVNHHKGRPVMQFFEGSEGMQRAFLKLLENKEMEWLHFVPAAMKEEDDPINAFRVQVFRERRKRKILSRCIVPNVPLGRRYKSSDIFQYRQSRLIPPEDFPVSFEKIIVGDTVACIDSRAQKASFIHYKELADGQRKLFNVMWRQAMREGETETAHESVRLPWAARWTSIWSERHKNTKVACVAIVVSIALVLAGLLF